MLRSDNVLKVWKLTSEVDVKNYDQTLSKHKIWDLKIRPDYFFLAWMLTWKVKVILYSYLILKKMNERITDS